MKKLVGYITSSFPENSFTIDLALAMHEAGMDILELGIPFADPVADGPVIEKANLLALEKGFRLNDLFTVSQKLASKVDTFWMGYMNPFYNKGFEFFLQKAKQMQIQGMIIPDLPFEETLRYKKQFEQYEKDLITFVAPTDSQHRIQTIAKESRKFIYLVAYAGITGSGQEEDLTQTISNIKGVTNTPIYLGFGVNEKTAKEKAKGVDGVIVGSAFVKHLVDESLSYKQKHSNIVALVKQIKEEINE